MPEKVVIEPPSPEQCGPIRYESYAQAQNSIMGRVARLMGFKRKVAPNFPKVPPLFIFNISDQELVWHEPGFPRFVVPACAKGSQFSEPLAIPGIISEEYLQDASTEFNHYNAIEIAAAILKFGPGMKATLDERNKGFFISETNPPHPARLAEAQAKYNQWCDGLIKEADSIMAQGEKTGPNGQMLNESHYRAVSYRRQTRDWNRASVEMMDCPACGGAVPKSAAVHAQCGAIVNWELAVRMGLKKREDVPLELRWWKEEKPVQKPPREI